MSRASFKWCRSLAAVALVVLGPQATLDRGYAIVRRAIDDAIVRDPSDAPSGTRLSLRVASGELLATTDGVSATVDRRSASAGER